VYVKDAQEAEAWGEKAEVSSEQASRLLGDHRLTCLVVLRTLAQLETVSETADAQKPTKACLRSWGKRGGPGEHVFQAVLDQEPWPLPDYCCGVRRERPLVEC
jgi:hypothetical protein